MSETLFKTGDYIVNYNTVFLLIVAVVPGAPTLYATTNIKENDHIHWMTEFEAVDRGYSVGKPDFTSFEGLAVGDMLQIGQEGSYMKVLARIENAVLLSQMPDEGANIILDMNTAMMESLGSPIVPKDIASELQEARSIHRSYRRAGHWHDVRTLAMFNWKIVSENHN